MARYIGHSVDGVIRPIERMRGLDMEISVGKQAWSEFIYCFSVRVVASSIIMQPKVA